MKYHALRGALGDEPWTFLKVTLKEIPTPIENTIRIVNKKVDWVWHDAVSSETRQKIASIDPESMYGTLKEKRVYKSMLKYDYSGCVFTLKQPVLKHAGKRALDAYGFEWKIASDGASISLPKPRLHVEISCQLRLVGLINQRPS